MKHLKIVVTDTEVVIEGSPVSLDTLGQMLIMKAKMPDNYFVTLTGNGALPVRIEVPGCECPEWMKWKP